MIDVLTQDRIAKSQLSLILRELGYEARFHADLATLALRTGNQPCADIILIDLQLNQQAHGIEMIKTAHSGARLIGFQHYSSIDSDLPVNKPAELSHHFILPAHAQRAKARIQSTLKEATKVGTSNKHNQKRSTIGTSHFTRAATQAKNRLKLSDKRTLFKPHQQTLTSNYITAHSLAAQHFIQAVKHATLTDNAILLTGHEGAEFELAAREINYQSNADAHSIVLLCDNTIDLETLEKIERKANKDKAITYCYLGKVDELMEPSMRSIQDFLQYLAHLRNPHLRLILSYENGSDHILPIRVLELIKEIQPHFQRLVIPEMAERGEDIRSICLHLLSTLRTAHPFLQVKSISNESIEYLVEHRQQLNYSGLVRIIRNSVALSQQHIITPEDFKNYGESETTTQHLLESMADEQFFPPAHPSMLKGTSAIQSDKKT
jgi:DNA-binding NtrC family response regulator